MMDEATKDDLLERFRAYLDSVAETGEDGEDGEDANLDDVAPAPDLFSLLAELAAIKNEVKLESRQVKTAVEEFRDLFAALRKHSEQQLEDQKRRCEQARAADRASERDLLLELLDLRDRLSAGQEQAARYRPRWFARLTSSGKRASRLIAGLAEGMGMNLRRLDETLARRDVRPLPTCGRPFDPHRMHAAELAQDPTRPNGEVVAELRSGWLLHDKLLRPAEVVVNRSDSTDITESP